MSGYFLQATVDDRALLLGIAYITAQFHLLECDLMGGMRAL